MISHSEGRTRDTSVIWTVIWYTAGWLGFLIYPREAVRKFDKRRLESGDYELFRKSEVARFLPETATISPNKYSHGLRQMSTELDRIIFCLAILLSSRIGTNLHGQRNLHESLWVHGARWSADYTVHYQNIRIFKC